MVRAAFRNPRPVRPEGKYGAWKTALVDKDQVGEHLNKFDKPIEFDEIYPEVLTVLANVIVRPLSITVETLWWWGAPEDWRGEGITPIFKKDSEDYRPISLFSVPRKMMEQILLQTISKHMKDKNVIGSS